MPPSPQRRNDFLRLINQYCDVTLAVSDRTGQIARGFGLRKVETCRIGTVQAEKWPQTAPRRLNAQTLRLAYLGYMRRDKGFEFLLDALRALPATKAASLHLTVAAQRGAPEVMRQLETLRPKLAGLTWHDGYTHRQLDQILDKADFGLVPVLWEDNLPQTALEMHARHIPLITSDRGGAQELSGDARLVFRAGDTADFARALTHARRGFDPQRYWAKAPPPMDMESHLRALDQFYAGKSLSDDRGAA